jgi:hypothetical protein
MAPFYQRDPPDRVAWALLRIVFSSRAGKIETDVENGEMMLGARYRLIGSYRHISMKVSLLGSCFSLTPTKFIVGKVRLPESRNENHLP